MVPQALKTVHIPINKEPVLICSSSILIRTEQFHKRWHCVSTAAHVPYITIYYNNVCVGRFSYNHTVHFLIQLSLPQVSIVVGFSQTICVIFPRACATGSTETGSQKLCTQTNDHRISVYLTM